MKKIFIIILMLLAFGTNLSAQSIQRSGNNFTQVSNGGKTSEKETKTQYTYTDSKGTKYPIYLSSSGKAFVKKVSKKTGKEYKQYLPDVGKAINPKAYEKK